MLLICVSNFTLGRRFKTIKDLTVRSMKTKFKKYIDFSNCFIKQILYVKLIAYIALKFWGFIEDGVNVISVKLLQFLESSIAEKVLVFGSIN